MISNIKRLEEMQHVADCSKTSLPREYVPKTKFEDRTANGLTKSVIAWIKLHNGQAERINTMGRYLPGKTVSKGFYGTTTTKGKYIPTTSTPGSADISATIRGRSVKIEVKIGADRQSDAQRKYQQDVEAAGGIYWIVKTFDQFIELWQTLQH